HTRSKRDWSSDVCSSDLASPLCGNTVSQDRRFMFKYMPEFERFFHYRNLDVSTLKELAKRWHPEVYRGVVKKGRHEALADIYERSEERRVGREGSSGGRG